MKTARVLIAAVLFLAAGAGVIFNYCHGSIGMSVGDPVSSGTKLAVDFTTMGVPVLVGVPLVLVGGLLLLIAFFAAIAVQFQRRAVDPEIMPELNARRHRPFAE